MPEKAAGVRPAYEEFHDREGRSYTCDLAAPLGRGGQGMVLRVRDDVYSAVKIEWDRNGPRRDAPSRAAFKDRIRALRRLPIPAACRVSMPVTLLEDVAGCVMRFLGEMRSLNSMLPLRTPGLLTADGMPAWVRASTDDDLICKQLYFYARSGGLRGRLHLLLQLAETLCSLHGEGLLFGDLSPNNVFMDRTGEVWLIDTDNIEYDGRSGSYIWTSPYGAPEIVRGEAPVSIAGDAYSFAVLAFETLTMALPFDDDIDAAGRSERGELPWICDHEDAGNRAVPPLLDQYLTPTLFRLFSSMFEQGRLASEKRPHVWMFRDALARALDICVRCPACGMSFVAGEPREHTCRFCDAALPPRLVITAGGTQVFTHEAEAGFTAPWRIFGPEKRPGHALRFEWQDGIWRIFPGGAPGDLLHTAGGALVSCPEVVELDQARMSMGLRFALRRDEARQVSVRLLEG